MFNKAKMYAFNLLNICAKTLGTKYNILSNKGGNKGEKNVESSIIE